MSKNSYLFGNISGLSAYFSKLIFALKPRVQASRFEYHKPYNQKIIFWNYKGVPEIKKIKNLKYSPCSEHQMVQFFHYPLLVFMKNVFST